MGLELRGMVCSTADDVGEEIRGGLCIRLRRLAGFALEPIVRHDAATR